MATIGISDHAQDALGDIVFVDLPEPGAIVNAKDEVAVVESGKAASDLYSPISGEIIEVNGVLAEAPETVNSGPYENGWFLKMTISDAAELDELMDADAYSDIVMKNSFEDLLLVKADLITNKIWVDIQAILLFFNRQESKVSNPPL